MAALDETNFDFPNAFKLDFQSFVAHFIQLNKTNFIGFLFCRVNEAYALDMKNGKVAAFCTLGKKYRCLPLDIDCLLRCSHFEEKYNATRKISARIISQNME